MSDKYVLDESAARQFEAMVRRWAKEPISGPIAQQANIARPGIYCEIVVGEPLEYGSGSGSGSGQVEVGDCGYEIWYANTLIWNPTRTCWDTDAAVWAVHLRGLDLETDGRYLAKIVESARLVSGAYRPLAVVVGTVGDDGFGGSGSGSGSGGTQYSIDCNGGNPIVTRIL